MLLVIYEWIRKRLGRMLDLDADEFIDAARDGYLLAELLRSYEIITEDQFNMIQCSSKSQECYENFTKYLRHWLRMIHVDVTEKNLKDIISGQSQEIVHLFYRVYLELNDKTSLDFVTRQKMVQKLYPENLKFTVMTVNDEDIVVPKLKPNKYCAPLLEGHDVIHWYSDRLNILQQQRLEARENYLASIGTRVHSLTFFRPHHNKYHETNENRIGVHDFQNVDQDMPYEDLLRQQKRIQKLPFFQANPDEAKRILNKLHAKTKLLGEKRILKRELQKELLDLIWEDLQKTQVQSFNQHVVEKLLRQSYYEKQMVYKLAEVKLQTDVIIKNKLVLQSSILKQKETEFTHKLLQRSKSIEEEKLMYYLERQRLLELHKRIRERRIYMRKQRHYNICADALEDIIDIVMRHTEDKQTYDEEPSKRVVNMRQALFANEEPINDLVNPLEVLLEPDDNPEVLDEIKDEERHRQDVLDKTDFDNYLNWHWPFVLPSTPEMQSVLQDIERGLNILGSIVHQMLLTKYPLPNPEQAPQFPAQFKITVCINSLPDLNCLPDLQRLLNHKQVKVVQMEDAINFCIQAFKDESQREYDDSVWVQETEEALKKSHKGKKGPKSKVKDKKEKREKKQPRKSGTSVVEEPPAKVFEDKLVQTPRIYPDEEIKFTPQAELGKVAVEELGLGQPLTDYLLVCMFTEYLKSLPSTTKGWALINFPINYNQAALLEEVLTGVPVCNMDAKLNISKSIYSSSDLLKRYDDTPFDTHAKDRCSQILPNPCPPAPPDPVYNTILTAYIKIKLDEGSSGSQHDLGNLPPGYEDLEAEPDPLDKFYSNLGCNYSMYYEKFDITTVKYLAKLVIGDFSLPLKGSVELFGDTVHFIEAGIAEGEDRPRSAKAGKQKKKPKEKKKSLEGDTDKKTKSSGETVSKDTKGKSSKSSEKKKGKKPAVVIVREDKWVQMPALEEEEEEVIEEPLLLEPSPSTAFPGDANWDFLKLPLPYELQLALVMFWEQTEENYVDDFQQLFFYKRLILDAIIPYVQFVREQTVQFLQRTDAKQLYLRDFQMKYNQFDGDFRSDVEFKAELHCRIEELRQKLLGMCEERMLEAQKKRREMIGQNWVPKQMCELSNYCITAFQLEIDRCANSLQLLNDYYAGVVTKMPNKDTVGRLELGKIECRTICEQPSAWESINTAMEEQQLGAIDTTFFHERILEQMHAAKAFVEKCHAESIAVLDRVKGLFKPPKKDNKGDKKGKKEKPTKKPKAGSEKTGDDKLNYQKIFEPENIVKENYDKIVDEWLCGIDGERERVKLRLISIKSESFERFEEVLNCCHQKFYESLDIITKRYENEVQSVEDACRLLRRAVEEEVPIQEELCFNGDQFSVNPQNLLYEDPLFIPEPAKETPPDGAFSLAQLYYLTNVLLDLAPSGYIAEQSFVFVLQDMITSDPEDGCAPLVPPLWHQLDPLDVMKVSRTLFDNIEYIQWKDFILYNLFTEFPTERQLLDLRQLLREHDPDSTELVYDYQFNSTKFWFEDDPVDPLRLQVMKKLIYKMYCVKHDQLNYTAMLLDFSKDRNPIVGLTKALEVALGKLICWDDNIGKIYAATKIREKECHDANVKIRDEEREQNVQFVGDILTEVINETVHVCDSVVIEDIPPTPPKNSPKILPDDIIDYLNRLSKEMENNEEEGEGSAGLLPFFMDDLFSNLEIGFEPMIDPAIVYLLPWEVVLVVVVTTLPWHARVQNICDKSFKECVEEIYNNCRSTFFNGAVLAHEFLNNYRLVEMLGEIRRFTVKNPVEIVWKILMDKAAEKN